jgi:hypothetical protein
MKPLDKSYMERLDEIAEAIQESDELATYLEEEDEESYKSLIEAYEPSIEALYEEVSMEEPLQLIPLEDALLEDRFEGLFLPRVLGYNILRGEVNQQTKFVRSQERVDKVLKSICESANFDYLTHRIGQSVQIIFALSSDIWATNFIDRIPFKKQKQYLLTQKLEKFIHEHERKLSFTSYARQFSKFRFHTTTFPNDMVENRALFYMMSTFLKSRAEINEYNTSFVPQFIKYLNDESFHFSREHTLILGLLINYFDIEKKEQAKLKDILNKLRDASNFTDVYFNFLLELFQSKLKLNSDCDRRVAEFVDFKKADDDLTRYYSMTSTLVSKGFMHDDSIEAVQKVYGQYEGMSLFNECVRQNVLGYFSRLLSNLEPESYNEYFETDKYYRIYMGIFGNEQFAQALKALSMQYLKALLKTYSDKRSREYQDVRKFFSHQFLEYGFMKEKEVAEYFKTKRKKSA